MINAMFKQTMKQDWHNRQCDTVRFERDENISTSPSLGIILKI